MLAPPHLQCLRHLLLADLLQPRQVGQSLRQPQRPVVGAAAETLAGVEVGEEPRCALSQRARTCLGRGHLRITAAAAEAVLLALPRLADALSNRCRPLSRRAADL